MNSKKLLVWSGAVLFLAVQCLPAVAEESGCIVRDPAGAWFKRDSQLDRYAVVRATVDAFHQRGSRVLDPCQSGEGTRLSQAAYARMAQKRPDLFRPLDNAKLGEGSTSAMSYRPHPVENAYRYIYLDGLVSPEYFSFDPVFLDNRGVVTGTGSYVIGDDLHADVVTIKNQKVSTRVRDGFVNSANERGLAAGFVVTDPVFFYTQAVIFEGAKARLVPRRPGEQTSQVLQVNDEGVALIYSEDQSGNGSLWTYNRGKWTSFDPAETGYLVSTYYLTNRGLIVGTLVYSTTPAALAISRGYQFDPRTGKLVLLEPAFAGDTDTWVMAVNSRDQLLGYSFVPNGIEHVGIWSPQGDFKNYFTEGTAEFPTVSNALAFSDNDQIVISRISRPAAEVNNVYIVPRPGVRFNLLDRLTDFPEEQGHPSIIRSINDEGDMTGYATNANFQAFSFLIKHVGRFEH